MRFHELVGSSHVNGTSRPIAAADAKPVGFAVVCESKNRVAGQRAVGLVETTRGEKVFRNGVSGVGPLGFGEQPKR